MNYRDLGRTGVKVSPLCLGCMNFGQKTPPDEAGRIIDRAIDAGINFFDTSNSYGRGQSERVTGEALKRNGKRDRIVLATKVFGKMADDDPNMVGLSRRHILIQCEASLQRLQTDRIDLYQLHRPMSSIPIDETLRALDDLIRAGKVRYIGTSTFAPWQVVESIWIARELGLNRFVCEQPPYHMLERRIERELVPVAQQYGLAIIPWSPLAGGFLTGKYQRGQLSGQGRLYSEGYNTRRPQMMSDAGFRIVETAAAIAREKNCTTSQFSLAWNMYQPGITAPIIGPRTLEQVEDNLKAADVEVTDADRGRIDEVAPPGGVISANYDGDWAAKTWQ